MKSAAPSHPVASRRRGRRGDRAEKFMNVYVKHFPEETSDDQLGQMFSKYGKITSAKVMRDDTAKSKGFGFVVFEDPEAAESAVEAMHGQDVGMAKPLYVQRAQSKFERMKDRFEKLKMERTKSHEGVNLYIKNLDAVIDDKILRKEFQPYGNITSAKVMRDEQNASKGFGFVCFSSPEEATKAITEMNGRIIVTKPLYVALAQRKEVRKAQLASQCPQRQTSERMQNQQLGLSGADEEYGEGDECDAYGDYSEGEEWDAYGDYSEGEEWDAYGDYGEGEEWDGDGD